MIYFWFIIGAIVGSFLNVCIHRLPRGESIIFPPSHCPHCSQKLAPYDLIPVISYLHLRGRCRGCGQPISLRYPLVELLSAAAFALVWQITAGNNIEFAFQVIFLELLIAIFLIDLEQQVVPDLISGLGIFSGLFFGLLRGNIISSIIGLAAGYALLYFIAKAGIFVFKKEAVGDGDLLIAAVLGANLGWPAVLVAIFLAYMLAGILVAGLLISQRAKLGEYIPFGPALAAGGAITLFFGDSLLGWYLGLL